WSGSTAKHCAPPRNGCWSSRWAEGQGCSGSGSSRDCGAASCCVRAGLHCDGQRAAWSPYTRAATLSSTGKDAAMPKLLLRFLGLSTLLLIGGCHSLLDYRYQDTLPLAQGEVVLPGVQEPVSIRRNALGMPFIEAGSLADVSFALGSVHAADRLGQMEGMRLMAAGRLAEMVGPEVLDIDRFMRAVDLRRAAEALERGMSPEVGRLLERYAEGVNSYLAVHGDRLPLELDAAGHRPEPWTTQDSLLVFCLLNFGLAANLQEEIAALVLAQRVGAERLAW